MADAPHASPARRWPWWLGLALVFALGLHLTVRAYHEQLPAFFDVPGVDKVVHAAMAGSLFFFLDGALGRPRLRGIPLAAVLVLVPAGIEEILQRYSVARTSSVWDFLADVAGVLLLWPAANALRRRARRN
ncbi:MAG: hypothetical protein JWP97_5123 [Labilithrix sp.]|nr:hypothetical protein [Labilithrix sp.]